MHSDKNDKQKTCQNRGGTQTRTQSLWAAEEKRRRGFWEGDEGRAKGYGEDEKKRLGTSLGR